MIKCGGILPQRAQRARRRRFSQGEIVAVFRKTEGRCRECGRRYSIGGYGETWTVDHILPFSQTRSNASALLALTCIGCNQRKGDRYTNRDTTTVVGNLANEVERLKQNGRGNGGQGGNGQGSRGQGRNARGNGGQRNNRQPRSQGGNRGKGKGNANRVVRCRFCGSADLRYAEAAESIFGILGATAGRRIVQCMNCYREFDL